MTDKAAPDLSEIVAREIGTPPAADRSMATRALEYICAALMLAMVALLFTQVLGRYALHNPPEWTEEMARLVFVYVTFIGASVAVVRKAHLKIDSITEHLPKRMQAAINAIGIAAAIVFLGYVIFHGMAMLEKVAYQEFSTVPLSKAVQFAAVPIGCGIVLLYELGRLWTALRYLVFGDTAVTRHARQR